MLNMADYIPRKQRTMAPSEQRLIVAAREDRVYWRGEDAEFGKPPPPGKTTDEVRAMISQKRERAAGWWNKK